MGRGGGVMVTAEPEMLRVSVVGGDTQVGVSVQEQLIRGFVVAQLGEFKDKRGMFNEDSLNKIVELGNAAGGRGLRSRLSHPNESDDGLTKHLGRATNFRRDGASVRADLKIADVAMSEPVGGGKPIGLYVMELAQEDPGALGSSLVLKTQKLERKGPDGERMPSLWTPTELFASDIVADGDAVHGDLLSVDGLDEFMEGSVRRVPTKLAVAGAQYLDQMFPDSDRAVVAARIEGFKTRYLTRRFGADELSRAVDPAFTPKESDMDAETSKALAEQNARIDALTKIQEQSAKSQEEALSKQREVIESLHSMMKDDIDSRVKERSATSRASEIAALCKMAGNNSAEQFIADESLSVDDVKLKLIAGKNSSAEGLGTSTSPTGDRNVDPVDKLRAQWDEKKELLQKSGYRDRETWVRHQCRDNGMTYKAA